MDNNNLKAVLKEFLQESRYVLVFDDIWSIDAWDAIKIALPNSNCGSRVLLTTRIGNVAATSYRESHGYIYEMKALSPNESWTLFCDADVLAEVPLVAEVISEDIGIRDKQIRDKSPRMKKDFKMDKNSTLRGSILISWGVQMSFALLIIFERHTDLIVGVPPGGRTTAGDFPFCCRLAKSHLFCRCFPADY
ncbi:hypothetical protein ACSBR1_037923 [Camellia fascicularis]